MAFPVPDTHDLWGDASLYNYDRVVSSNKGELEKEREIVLGAGPDGHPLYIPLSALDGHLLILGKSGTGKSNMVYNLVRQLDGKSHILMDPHGTLLDRVLNGRGQESTIHLTPGTLDHDGITRAISFNMLSTGRVSPEEIDRSTGWIRDMMANEQSLSGGSWGPRLEVIFRVVLSELLRRNPDSNLVDLAETVSNRKSMKTFLDSTTEGSIRKFLEGQYGDWKSWTQYISSTMNRLMPLLSSPVTRYLISGRSDSIDIYSELSEGDKLITLDISKTKHSEEAVRIVSSLFLMKAWTAILAGFGRNRKKLETYIVIDEFQSIPAGLIDTILREGRKFGIRLILASQFLDSSRRDLIQSVFGNVRNYMAFNLSDQDAREVSRVVADRKTSRKLVNVIKGQKLHRAVFISQTENGIVGPVSFMPDYHEEKIDYTTVERIKLESMIKYSLPVESVTSASPEKSVHEKIIDDLETALLKSGVEVKRSARMSRSIADAAFSHSGKEFVVEVEVSDVTNKFRLLSKLKSYPGRNLILVCPEGRGNEVHDSLVEPVRFRARGGFVLEIPAMEGGDRIYSRDIAETLLTTIIIEHSESGFRSYWNRSTRRFLMRHLMEPGTFQRELDYGEFAEVRNYLFRIMRSTGMFALKKEDILENGPIKSGILDDFFRKCSKADSEFLYMKELFA